MTKPKAKGILNSVYILLLLLSQIALSAQTNKIPFETYGVKDGLPEELVLDLLQDDQGFIWFGTQNGLVRYDGYDFHVFKNNVSGIDSSALNFRRMGRLLKSKEGTIFMNGRSQIASYNPVTERIKNFDPNQDSSNIQFDAINLQIVDEQENVWFSSFNSSTSTRTINRLNPRSGLIKQFPIALSSNQNKNAFQVAESSIEIWLLGVNNDLHVLNPKTDSFEVVLPTNLPPDSPQGGLMFSGEGTRLLITDVYGLTVFDTEQRKITKRYKNDDMQLEGTFPEVYPLYALEDKKNIYVFHVGGKISIINRLDDEITTHSYGEGKLAYEGGPPTVSFFWAHPPLQKNNWMHAITPGGDPFLLEAKDYFTSFDFYDYRFNDDNNLLPSRYPTAFYNFMYDHNGLLWLGTRPSLHKQAPRKRQMDFFQSDPDDLNSLPSDHVQSLFQDSKERLWVGTDKGLALYQPASDDFRHYVHNSTDRKSLSNDIITAIHEDAQGKIWVGTANGLNLWDEPTGTFKRHFYNSGESNYCRVLYTDNQERLWVSITNKGVFALDSQRERIVKSFTSEDSNPTSLAGNNVQSIHQDFKGNIWFGHRNAGLNRLNEDESGFIHYSPTQSDSTKIVDREIMSITEDSQNRLWVGTDNMGMNLYDHEADSFTPHYDKWNSSIGLMGEDDQGKVWFMSYSGSGLLTIDETTNNFKYFGEEKGLLQNDQSFNYETDWISKDEFGDFWIPTQRGLSVFDPQKETFRSYFEKDGFQAYTRGYVTLKTKDGDIWIGGLHGLNRITPKDLLVKDSSLVSVVITDMSINDTLYSKPDGDLFTKSVSYTDAISLKHWQKDLNFSFVGLHYLRSEDNQYSWKLENYDRVWTDPSTDRSAKYTNLSPGSYTFQVKGSNADGIWNENPTSMAITILPPWWKTWWAYVAYALLIAFLGRRVHIYQKQKTIRIEKEKALAKELAQAKEIEKAYSELKNTQTQLVHQAKMASLGELTAGIAHEIQNPLNFVNNFSDINSELISELIQEINDENYEEVKSIASDLEKNEIKIKHHGNRADSIVKGMLQHSRTGNGKRELTDINAMTDEYLRLAYHGLRAKDKTFNATMETDFDKNIGKVEVIAQDMGRVILNLINNAFQAVASKASLSSKASIGEIVKEDNKYKPLVTISTKLKPSNNGNTGKDQIEITITDNGNGIPDEIKNKIFQPFFTTKPTGQGTGLGLSLSHDIVTKGHGGKISFESKMGEGSSFTVTLPK
ncbi:MAG: hypothetical protein KJP00_13090 [Bacteroidia bacterium]|nr:hypothetical protein [Bacteroidia bacterium]